MSMMSSESWKAIPSESPNASRTSVCSGVASESMPPSRQDVAISDAVLRRMISR